MNFSYFSKNGEILSIEQAVYPLTSIEFTYGFGVYETIKVRNTFHYFLDQHVNRLFDSADIINLQHQFTEEEIKKYILNFIQSIKEHSYNLKLLLIGTAEEGKADFMILPSTPSYPKRQWYRDGVKVISAQYERWKPQAKTLNMLTSYYLYKEASKQGAYDALLYDKGANILEGTRTNVYVIKDYQIFSPPKNQVLEGVTMMTLEKVIKNSPFTISYQNIPFPAIFDYDGMFLTSTSTKIIPIKKIDGREYETIVQPLKELIQLYDKALDESKGEFGKLGLSF